MIVYLINMLLTIFWGMLFIKKDGRGRKHFVIIVTIQLILLSALRDISIGEDTWNYESNFYELINPAMSEYYGWGALFRKFFEFGTYTSRDIGFGLFTKLFATIIPNFRVYLFAIAIFFSVSLGIFLYKYSEDICLSYVMFESILLRFFLLTGIRQTIAVTLTVFWGYELIRKKKLFKYLLLCLVAFTFHSSALIMIPVYFIFNRKREIKWKYEATLIFSLVLILAKNLILPRINLGIFSIYAETTGIGSYTFIIIMIAIVFCTMLFQKNGLFHSDYEWTRDIVDGTLISEVFVVLSVLYSIFFRLGYYCIFFMLCLMPILIKSIEVNSRKLVRLSLYAILLLYTVRLNMDYAFFF